jgi:hypothetical protein
MLCLIRLGCTHTGCTHDDLMIAITVGSVAPKRSLTAVASETCTEQHDFLDTPNEWHGLPPTAERRWVPD